VGDPVSAGMTFVLFRQPGADTPAGWAHADKVSLDFTHAPLEACVRRARPLNLHTWRVLVNNTIIDCSEKPA
jgi:hypothetical protein